MKRGDLTGMSSVMCFEMGALGVCLAAAGERAGVCGGAFPGPGASSPFGLGLQQLEGRGRRCEQCAVCLAPVQAEAVFKWNELLLLLLRLCVGRWHALRVSRLVIALWKHAVAQPRLAVSPVVRAERWGHAAGRLRGNGQPGLFKGHHAGRVALLLDSPAALGHHAHNWPIAIG